MTLRIPLPVRPGSTPPHRPPAPPDAGSALLVKVSSMTGLIEITDTGAASGLVANPLASGSAGAGAPRTGPAVVAAMAGNTLAAAAYNTTQDRGKRAAQASQSVNDGRTRLGDDLGRLVVAVSLPALLRDSKKSSGCH